MAADAWLVALVAAALADVPALVADVQLQLAVAVVAEAVSSLVESFLAELYLVVLAADAVLLTRLLLLAFGFQTEFSSKFLTR